MRLLLSSCYILVGIGLHWLEYVIGIVVKVQWNTFVSSVTISRLAYFRTVAPKYEVFCVFKQISTLKALTTDAVTASYFGLSVALYHFE
jgi:hypothetical protein